MSRNMLDKHYTDSQFWREQSAVLRSLADKTEDLYLKGVFLRRADEYACLGKKAEARLCLSR
jgi:hypothetical protein